MRNRRSHDDDGKATVMFFGTTQEPKIHLLSSLLTGMSAAGRVFSPTGKIGDKSRRGLQTSLPHALLKV